MCPLADALRYDAFGCLVEDYLLNVARQGLGGSPGSGGRGGLCIYMALEPPSNSEYQRPAGGYLPQPLAHACSYGLG